MKHNLAVSGGSLSNVPSFLQLDFNLITQPYLHVINTDVYKNFDTYLFYDSDESFYTHMCSEFNRLGVNYIGGPRLAKSVQHHLMRKLDIPCPSFAYRSINISIDPRQDDILALLGDFDDSDLFIVKGDYGARGLAQAKLSKFELVEFFDDCGDKLVSDEDFYETWGEKLGGVPEDSSGAVGFFRDAIKTNDFVITRYIDNIAGEFRLVYLQSRPDNPMVVIRKTGENWQANSAISHYGKPMDYKDLPSLDGPYTHVMYGKLLEDVRKIVDVYNYPWLSVDVYLTNTGFYGIFEFQMQFGYNRMPKSELVSGIIESVETVVYKK